MEGAFRECEIFLIILTPAINLLSKCSKDEIGYAIDRGKRILPVLLEECDIPLRLRRFQYVDFTKTKFGEGVKKAKHLLGNILNDQPTPFPTMALPKAQEASKTEVSTFSSLPAQKQSLTRRWVLGGAGILAVTALLGALSVMLIFRNSIFPPAPTEVIPTPPPVTPTQLSGVPLIETVDVSSHPAIPGELKEAFFPGPDSLELSTTTNIIRFKWTHLLGIFLYRQQIFIGACCL